MKKNIIILLGIFTITFFACNDDDDKTENFDDKAMISSIVEKIIKPEEIQFYDDTVALQAITKTFGESTTPDNLEKLKTQWLVVAKSWARCYSFNIGDVKLKRLFNYISKFPVRKESLENKINIPTDIATITPKYVLKMGADTKGLFGLEYLLFKDDTAETVAAFSASENRRKMLQLIVDELLVDVTSHKNEWDKYAPKFIANDVDRGNISNSFNMFFNGLNNVIHYAWETKIGKPAGLGKKKFPQVSLIEAHYSKKTLELIKENVAMTKKIYFSEDFISISDKVKFVTKNDKINNAVKARYAKIEGAIAAIDVPLYDAINSEKDKVKTLYDEMKLLEGVEFSTDVKSTLSLIITGTDGDGD